MTTPEKRNFTAPRVIRTHPQNALGKGLKNRILGGRKPPPSPKLLGSPPPTKYGFLRSLKYVLTQTPETD